MTHRACFIVAPIGAKLGPLADVIVASGWRVLNFETATTPAARGYLDLVSGADAVIVVDPAASPNLLFETGVAMGRGVPVLLMVMDEVRFPPLENEPALATLPRVRCKLTDTAALGLHIPAFLDSIDKASLSRRAGSSESLVLPKSTSGKSDKVRPESVLEQQLLDLFERAPEVLTVGHAVRQQNPEGRPFTPDFALWMRQEHSLISNPVIVEITRQLRGAEIERKIGQLRDYAISGSISAAILVEDSPDLPLTLVDLRPMIVRVGLATLEELLLGGRLVSAVTQARNLAVHGLR